MTQIDAIKYLAKNSVYTNEWTGTGMWEAVETVLATGKTLLTKEYLDTLLKIASER